MEYKGWILQRFGSLRSAVSKFQQQKAHEGAKKSCWGGCLHIFISFIFILIVF